MRRSEHRLKSGGGDNGVNLRKILQLTLFTRSEERVDQRSEVGVSPLRHAFTSMHWRHCIGVNAASRGLTRFPDIRD